LRKEGGVELLVEKYEQQLIEWVDESELDFGKLKSHPIFLILNIIRLPGK